MTTDAENIAMAFMEDFTILDQDGIELDAKHTKEVLVEYFEDAILCGKSELRHQMVKELTQAEIDASISCAPVDTWKKAIEIAIGPIRRRVRNGN